MSHQSVLEAADASGSRSRPTPAPTGRVSPPRTVRAPPHTLQLRPEAYQAPHPSPSEASAPRDIVEEEEPLQTPPVTIPRQTPSPGAGMCDGGRDNSVKRAAEKYTKEMRAALLVVMSLVASVTYQAGLNPPGGVWQDDSPDGSTNPHRAGDPILRKEDPSRYRVFTAFNGLAFVTSLGNMMLLMTDLIFSAGSPTDLRMIKGCMIVSLFALGIAYGAGSCQDWPCTSDFWKWVLLYLLATIGHHFLYKREKQKKKMAASSQEAVEEVEADVELHGVQPQGNIYPSGSCTIYTSR